MGAEPRIRVSALLRWGGGILLCRHDKRGQDVWLLPGGGVHSGETLMDAVTGTAVLNGIPVTIAPAPSGV